MGREQQGQGPLALVPANDELVDFGYRNPPMSLLPREMVWVATVGAAGSDLGVDLSLSSMT